jgi:L-seryl-tRNA(Ser) seleniumtransferase
MGVYNRLGVRRVINACGIYTDLGGSCLSAGVWTAAAEANRTWGSVPELLDRAGARIAQLVHAEAARVVPGASAGIALAVGACIARGDGAVGEALPQTDAVVLLQRGHAYKYARCARLAGARVVEADDLAAAVRELRPVAILHPAHLDAAAMPLEQVRRLGVPVVVDAAYLSYPLDELARWADADFACFSAKYFWGPNGGGFVAGRRERIADLAALDFTGYESGEWRTFGRAFKLDRATIVATVAALEEWVEMDHAARWEGYAALARELAAALPHAEVSLKQFTLDERLVDGPVNALVVHGAAGLEGALAAGDPSVRAIVDGDALVLCTETLAPGEVVEVAGALEREWRAAGAGARS